MRLLQSDRTMRAAMLREILLMIFFGTVEGWRGLDLCNDGPPKTPALFEFGQLGFSGGLLFGRVIENNRAILRTQVGALAIARGRVMVTPEDLQQRLKGNFPRIKSDFDYFRMASCIATNIFISRMFCLSTSIAHSGIFYSVDLPEDRLDSPKTSCSKRGFFSAHGSPSNGKPIAATGLA